MNEILINISKLPQGTVSAIATMSGAIGAIISCIITIIIGKVLLSARDKQDKEVEYRKHAIELTKMDLERKLRTIQNKPKLPLRPSILDFLANYRDLQELNRTNVKELYLKIEEKRISKKE
jgi:hypothetical protein